MSNTLQVYKEAIGDVIDEKQKEAQRLALEAAQKNIEAWAMWREIPQTKMFLEVLTQTRQKLSVGVSANTTHVPDVHENWIRARLVEIALIDEILGRTVQNGELRNEMFQPQAQVKG